MINGPVWDESVLTSEDVTPNILAIGDSWHWYPFNNLLNRLYSILNRRQDCVIFARGHNGALMQDYVSEPLASIIRGDLNRKTGYGHSLYAVFVSGGGNDFAGMRGLGSILLDDCSNMETAADCFKSGQPEGLFDTVIVSFDQLLGIIQEELGSGIPVFIAPYDYALPTGIGFLGLGQWLKWPMDQRKVPTALQADVVRTLIDTYENKLIQLHGKRPQLVVVNTLGTLGPDDWANELHPTASGFNKIANVWAPYLKNAGLA